jgi:hypothetical protein
MPRGPLLRCHGGLMADGNKYVVAVAQGTDGLQHVNAVML